MLEVAKPTLAQRIADPVRFRAQVLNAREGVGRLFAQMAAQVMQARALDLQAAALVGRPLVELLALDAEGRATPGASSAVRAAHRRRARDHVRRNLQDPRLSPETIAQACGISKRSLHELFAGENGTVSRFIREQRLPACRDHLEGPATATIAEVAYRYGFCGQAQFSRLFRAAFGETPSGFRARHAARDRAGEERNGDIRTA